MGIDLLQSSSTGCCYGTQDRKRVGASLPPHTSHTSQMRWKAHSFCGAERLTGSPYYRPNLKSLIYWKPEMVLAATDAETKYQKMTEVESHWCETDATSRKYVNALFLLWIQRQTWIGWGCDGELRCDLWCLTQSRGLTVSATRSLNHTQKKKLWLPEMSHALILFFLVSVSPSVFSSPLFFAPFASDLRLQSGWLTAKFFSKPAKIFSCWGSLVSSLHNTNCLRRH